MPSADVPATLTTLRMLEGLSYVEAALWIGARLAEGLAHAHERGVLHRDLKPANVLLTDEGQPMLLDFNLAEDVKAPGEAGRVGGTLPYMAPEHLAAYQGRPVDVDARSDIYALGVILYELLTGRHPFGRSVGGTAGASAALEQMIRDRTRLPPPARTLNRGVTPAVDSILRRCLAPNPARRYQTAAELQEDLDRQRLHRPLRHAPEPSLCERVGKWFRRNPRAVTATRVGVAAGVLMVLLTALLFWRGEQVARYESADRLKGFHDDLNTARLLLGARAVDVDERVEGSAAAPRPGPLPRGRRRPPARPAVVPTTFGRGKGARPDGAGRDAGAAGVGRDRRRRRARRRKPPEQRRRGPATEPAGGNVLPGRRAAGAVAQRADLEAQLKHDEEARHLARPGRRGAGARRRGYVPAGAGAGARAGWGRRRRICGPSPRGSRTTSPCNS